MKRKFTLVYLLCLLFFSQSIYSQTTSDPAATVYATLISGAWNGTTTWETYSSYSAAIAASPGGGVATSGSPSGTHNVLIRSGHTITMGGANRGCKSIIIQAGGKLWANETSARRLQLGAGGTGFTYPLTDTVQIDGVVGGTTDGIYFETGANAKYVNISGTGSIDIGRIRTVGGAGSAAGGVLVTTIDANINLTQSGNYALSTIYNPTATDNYTMTIAAGRTVTITNPTGYFNTNSGSAFGNYTYNILGTLDFTANTGTTGISQLQPLGSGSSVTLNVSGLMKAGSFTISTNSGAAGTLSLNINNGGTIEAITPGATYTFAPTIPIFTNGTGKLVRTVGASDVFFPASAPGSFETTTINNAGTADNFSVSVKNTFDFTPPVANRVERQWTINEAVAGGSNATIKLGWTTAAQSAGFNPAGSVSIYRYNGSSWTPTPATVTGTGTISDPYVATASGFTSFSPFIVANAGVPAPVNFIHTKAYSKNNGVQIEWTTAGEYDLSRYVIEHSADGTSFKEKGTVAPRNRSEHTNYSWFDGTSLNGTNYYRIKSVDLDGKLKYTPVLKVSGGKSKADFVLSPNPVVGLQTTLQLVELQKGLYNLRIYNAGGQTVYAESVSHGGGSSATTLVIGKRISSGVYSVELTGVNTSIKKMIVIQ